MTLSAWGRNQTVPFCYALVYHCPCGCRPPMRNIDYISPSEGGGSMDEPAVRERVKATAERLAEDLRRKGYLDVSVEPRYAGPDPEPN